MASRTIPPAEQDGAYFRVLELDDDGPVLWLVGELDTETLPVLQQILARWVPDARVRDLRVDVGELAFVDVQGLRELGRAGDTVAARGGRMTVERASAFFVQIAAVVAPGLTYDTPR